MAKIQTEVWIVIAALAFLLSWLIDKLAGPVFMSIGNPVAFLRSSILLHTYPFTATAILIRTLGIFISVMLIASVIRRKYFTKAITILLISVVAEFFAIQQLATGFRVTTIQWTLAIAYSAVALSLGVIWFVLKGIWAIFNPEESEKGNEKDESILIPPKENS